MRSLCPIHIRPPFRRSDRDTSTARAQISKRALGHQRAHTRVGAALLGHPRGGATRVVPRIYTTPALGAACSGAQ